jgi:hypothetical protein
MARTSQTAGGHKANLNNPNTSDESKQNSKKVLNEEYDDDEYEDEEDNSKLLCHKHATNLTCGDIYTDICTPHRTDQSSSNSNRKNSDTSSSSSSRKNSDTEGKNPNNVIGGLKA